MKVRRKLISRTMARNTVFPCIMLLVGVGVTACGSSTTASVAQPQSSSSAIAKEETFTPSATILEKAYGAASTTGIDQVALAALVRAETPVNASTLNLAMKCYKDNVCDTGHGTLTVALADGFGENAWRQVTHMEFILQALSYPQIRKIVYTDAQGSTTTAISNMRSLIAQKANVITGFMDAGNAMLPVIKEATSQGITVIPYTTSIGGTPGTDYTGFVGQDLCKLGKDFAQIENQQLNGHGSLVLLGGTPGNPLTAAWQACEKPALPSGITVVGSADTSWTQQGTFQAMSGFLSRFPVINGVSYEYADGFVGGLRAYKAGNRTPLNVVLTLRTDENDLFCQMKQLNDPTFKVFYGQGGSFQPRIALTAAMMKREGYPIAANIVVPFSLQRATASTCSPSLPSTAPVSTLVPSNVLKAMFP